jgi:hypothetical protein
VLSFAVRAAVEVAPDPDQRQGCASLGEVALLARALAEEQIDKPRAQSILARVYDIPDEYARKLARLVLESAYSDSSPAGEFATKLEMVCLVSRGDIESLLKAREGGSGPL